jgi:MOSC domain-containing protein YiiM
LLRPAVAAQKLAMQTVAELRSSLPQVGRIEWIGLSAGHRAPIQSVTQVEVIAGRGLAGDHHGKTGKSERQVTLIQHEHLAAIAAIVDRDDTPPELLRRNLVVSGINLVALAKSKFEIGGVLLEGTGPCDPCSRMEENLGPGGYNAMRGHGGITAIVHTGGTIQVGESVRLVEAASVRR